MSEENEITDAENLSMDTDVKMQELLDIPEALDALADRLGTSDLTVEEVREEAYRLARRGSSKDDQD